MDPVLANILTGFLAATIVLGPIAILHHMFRDRRPANPTGSSAPTPTPDTAPSTPPPAGATSGYSTSPSTTPTNSAPPSASPLGTSSTAGPPTTATSSASSNTRSRPDEPRRDHRPEPRLPRRLVRLVVPHLQEEPMSKFTCRLCGCHPGRRCWDDTTGDPCEVIAGLCTVCRRQDEEGPK